jgi:hypothetical protein
MSSVSDEVEGRLGAGLIWLAVAPVTWRRTRMTGTGHLVA